MQVEGKGWTDTQSPFDRLPQRAQGVVRDIVWALGRHCAGLCFRFVTDAAAISARWDVLNASLAMEHMCAVGCSGLDLYVKLDSGAWRWLGGGRPTAFPTNTAQLVDGIAPAARQFLLYFPLYNGVTSLELGLPSGACLANAPPRAKATARPIIFYGTSITQGACASRPGTPHPALLGRWLDREVINLGFSGNGKMEPEVAALLAELDPAVYVIDCLPNMDETEINERAEHLVRTLRAARPRTPILLVEDRTLSGAFLISAQATRHATSRAALCRAYEKLTASGITDLHYLAGDNLLGSDGDDTVDGSHPTDLGFFRQARAMQPVLARLLPS